MPYRNPEQQREYQRLWMARKREKDPEAIRKAQNKWKKANPEKVKKHLKTYRMRHPEMIRACVSRYRIKHREKYLAYKRKYKAISTYGEFFEVVWELKTLKAQVKEEIKNEKNQDRI